MDMSHRKRPGETIFAILMLALSLFLLWQAVAISGFSALSSPGSFPMAASFVMSVAAVVNLVRTLGAGPEGPGFLTTILTRRVVVFSLLILGFGLLLEPAGFLPAALLFLLAAMGFLWRRGPLRVAGIALVALVAIYIVFRLVFQVVLPEGLVPEQQILSGIRAQFSAEAPE
ncbi:tripartite tricarboxylate transporter TctB family protein [Paroceanicella profunda]|uniref:Tripartite tricarboxylate transporter TctB family protein n=1 Tax=Paroceanicella profunda TaxID=2579971 RepID=A0A5B8G1N8_9RHOB|nr:tripartite tricarboxylate transporter TctB family protein [Paroceanicella profunda]QDL92423.1 tripartite tricarboxylate transporter TctB family protein [Paroceanicella profunda]